MVKGPYCPGCPLFSRGQGFALTDGSGSNGVLLVAEALGEDEAREGRPLVGRAGTLFNRMLHRLGTVSGGDREFRRDDFAIANIVNCRPPDNHLTKAPWEFGAIDHCKPYLIDTLRRFKPRAIVAMGNQPLRWFTGHWGIESLRGYRFEYEFDGRRIPVVGTYHPSYIQRGNFELVRVWQLDVLKALGIAAGEVYDRPKDYICHPSPDAASDFARHYFDARLPDGSLPPLSFDIETPYIRGTGGDKDEKWTRVLEDDASWMILRISFSFEPFKAISIPWTPPYLETIRTLLASSGDKIVWNRHFDVPRVARNGCPAAGRIIDGMELWHYVEPSLPMGLKYVATFHCPDMQPWKLMSKTEPEWYNAADSDTALRVTMALIDRVKKENRWELFLRHVVDLGSVLDALTLRGINVDSAKRAEERDKFVKMLANETAALQPLIPDAVRPRQVFKLPIERLKKEGKWVEGRMVSVEETLTEKEIEKLAARAAKAQLIAEKKAAKAAAVLARKLEREKKKTLGKNPRGARSKSSTSATAISVGVGSPVEPIGIGMGNERN